MSRISVHKDDLVAETTEMSESRSADLGGYTVDFGSARAGVTMDAATFKGLPGSACPCPRWGVLLKGEFRVPFVDGRVDTVRAGEAYYLPPGHRFEVVEDCEYIEFSPTKELAETFAVVSQNLAAGD
jgi:hypothetical protein